MQCACRNVVATMCSCDALVRAWRWAALNRCSNGSINRSTLGWIDESMDRWIDGSIGIEGSGCRQRNQGRVSFLPLNKLHVKEVCAHPSCPSPFRAYVRWWGWDGMCRYPGDETQESTNKRTEHMRARMSARMVHRCCTPVTRMCFLW